MGLAGMAGVCSRTIRVVFGKIAFLVVYVDDICVFSKSMDEHLCHLEVLFQVLRAEKLFAHQNKYKYGPCEVNFLGHTVSHHGLLVDKSRTSMIANWPRPNNVKELQSFLGLARYYSRFIFLLAHIVLPLSRLFK